MGYLAALLNNRLLLGAVCDYLVDRLLCYFFAELLLVGSLTVNILHLIGYFLFSLYALLSDLGLAGGEVGIVYVFGGELDFFLTLFFLVLNALYNDFIAVL
jgi:hypothetical protein